MFLIRNVLPHPDKAPSPLVGASITRPGHQAGFVRSRARGLAERPGVAEPCIRPA